MQKRLLGPDLTRTINRQAQMLAAASFNVIRTRLESHAIALLRAGTTQVEAERAILGLKPPGPLLADGTDLI